MRVLFLSNVFPTPFDQNRGQFNLEIVENLRVEHDVRVVCPIGWTDRPWVRARRRGPSEADRSVAYFTYYYVPRVWYFWRDVFMWWSIRAPLRALTRAWRPDVLLAFWTHPDGDVARRLGAELGVPFVQIVGGSDVLVVARGLRRKKIVRTLLAADGVIAIGRDLGQSVQALGVDAARVTSVYLPVAPGPFVPGDRQEARRKLQLPADKPVVLWVGRFVPVKGLEVLMSAVRRLAAAVPDVRVYLIGDGPDLRRTRALVGREGLDDIVQFVGPVRHDLLGHWYRAADVTALSSHSEGVPNVLLESIACGTPFVGTRVGGVPEIADLSIDRLVPGRDPEALAQALAETLTHRSGVGRAGRLFATPQGLRDQFKVVFERAAQARLRARSA